MFAPTAGVGAVMLAFTIATVSLRCSERVDRTDELVALTSTASHTQQLPLESETDWPPSAGFDDLDADFPSLNIESCDFLPAIRIRNVATFCVFQSQASPTSTDLPGFRVAPKSLRELEVSEPERHSILKASLFRSDESASSHTGSGAETLEFSMLESVSFWGRLIVQGRVPGNSVPDAVLRALGKGKAGAKRIDISHFLVEIIPSEHLDLPKGIVVVSPVRLEASLKEAANGNAVFGPNTEVLRYEELSLPGREETDRRHIRRVVFIAVELPANRSLDDIIKALSNSAPATRKTAVGDLKAFDTIGYVLGELRTRVSFVK